MIIEFVKNIDLVIFRAVNQFSFKWAWLDIFSVFLSNYLVFFLVAILTLSVLKSRNRWRMVVISLASAFAARFIITDFIRFIHHRMRPFLVLNDSNLLIDRVNQSSFPSGHAAFCFGLATVVYLYNKRLGIVFFVAALLVSVARVFVGVHWPSDILAGAAVGIFSGWATVKIFKKS